jgi:hypothetical protein
MSTTHIIDFAETLRDLINEKIDECRNEIHNPILIKIKIG